jgi:ABC-type transport system involved in multi-copper enzyme maturation permease subunit
MTAISTPPWAFKGQRIRFVDIVRAEWTKFRSVRSSRWSLGVLAVVVVGASALLAGVQRDSWATMNAADRHDLLTDPVGGTLIQGMLWGSIVAAVLGVTVISGEYSTGAIRCTALAVPRRWRFLAAKAVVLAAAVLAISEVAGFAAFFVSRAILSSDVPMSLSRGGTALAVAGVGLSVTAFALFAMAIGALIRHTAGGVAAALALVAIVPTLVAGLAGRLGAYLNTFLPGGNAAKNIVSTGSGHQDSVLSAWPSFVVSCGWVVLLGALAMWLLGRRDV